MSIQVNEFVWKPGENDAEYIKPLKRSNEEAHSLMLKATGKLAKMAKTKANEWISVEDRLPEVAGWYLVFYNGSAMQVAFFKGKKWPFDNHYHKITHWMPLPEMPKGE